MDDSDQYYTFDPTLGVAFSRRVVTLPTLFLAMTLLALILGWSRLIAIASTSLVLLLVLCFTTLLAAIVGYRRSGTLALRCRTTLLFFCGGVFLAAYSSFASQIIQKPAGNGDVSDGRNERTCRAIDWLGGLGKLCGLLGLFRPFFSETSE